MIIDSLLLLLLLLLVVGQTKIENFMDNNLNDFFFFSFVSNKIIFILFVAILYFQIKKHYIIIYQLSKILMCIK